VTSGVCYRLWSEAEHESLELSDAPEIHRADLSAAVLDLANLGFYSDPEIAALPWVDGPRKEGLDAARRLLGRLQALKPRPGGVWSLTERGRYLCRLPVHPRIGHMIEQAHCVSDSFARDACDLAATLEEKELLRGGRAKHGSDLGPRLDALQDPGANAGVLLSIRDRILLASKQLQGLAGVNRVEVGKQQREWERKSLCVLVTWAFPELFGTSKEQHRKDQKQLAEQQPEQPAPVSPKGKGKGKGLAQNQKAAKQSAKGEGKGKGGNNQKQVGGNFILENGYPVDVSGNTLLSSDHIAVAAVTGEKVFWAMTADTTLLSDYGISVADPVNHKILRLQAEGDSEAGEQLSMLEVRRYLAGKACSNVNSEEELLSYMAQHPEEFPARDVADLMWDLARADSPRVKLLCDIVKGVIVPRCNEFQAAEMTEAACTLAVAGCDEQEALFDLAELILPRLDDLPLDSEGGNLSSLLWAFTELRMMHSELFKALAARAVRAMQEFEPRVLSDVREPCFWTFHRASATAWSNRGRYDPRKPESEKVPYTGFAPPQFFEFLAPLVLDKLHEIHPICCVYLMWSFSKAQVPKPELFQAVADRVLPVIQDLDRCGLAMFVWNFANIGDVNVDVFRATSEDTLRPERMAEMTPRDLSGIATAFGRSMVLNPPLMQALAEHGTGLLQDGIDQQCYRKPAKSLAREIYDGDFSARDGKVDSFDMLSLADMLTAFAEQQFVHLPFLELADEYMCRGLRQPPREVSNFLRFPRVFVRALIARARLAGSVSRGREVYESAAPHVARLLPELDIRDVARLVYGWAVLGPTDPWMLAALSSRLEELVLTEGKGWKLDSEDVENAKWALKELNISDRKVVAGLGLRL